VRTARPGFTVSLMRWEKSPSDLLVRGRKGKKSREEPPSRQNKEKPSVALARIGKKKEKKVDRAYLRLGGCAQFAADGMGGKKKEKKEGTRGFSKRL